MYDYYGDNNVDYSRNKKINFINASAVSKQILVLAFNFTFKLTLKICSKKLSLSF